MDNHITKRCTKCGLDLPATLEYFYKHTKMGLHPACKTCHKKHDAQHRASAVSKSCLHCGKPFPAYRDDLKYCGHECRYAAKSAEYTTKTCPGCQQEFSVKTSIIHRYIYCSKTCSHNHRGKPLEICERCGKQFTGDKRWQSRFCSEECRRPPHIIKCLTCGKERRVVPTDTDRRFCCFACYRKYTGETIPEMKIRQTLTGLNIPFAQEYPVGRFSIDFYLKDLNIALEVDGRYWHQDKARDARKDKAIIQAGIKVCRISDDEIEKTGNLDDLVLSRIALITPITNVPRQLKLL